MKALAIHHIFQRYTAFNSTGEASKKDATMSRVAKTYSKG